MERTINISENLEELNPWIKRSIELFQTTKYLDDILKVYPFQIATPQRLDRDIRRKILSAHQARNTNTLIELLKNLDKFPYEDPIWYLIKNISGCLENNPEQIQRIANSLYSMTAEETVVRLESAPKLNTQMGPMFNIWLQNKFKLLQMEKFKTSRKGIFILNSSEEEGKSFVNDVLNQNLHKRPDLVAKVNGQYIIGEAKWIGQPGGNQEKQVQEVITFCRNQRGNILRIGIVDGFPWALKKINGNLINDKVAVYVQESEYDVVSALLLKEYLRSLIN
jgi:hypothetical protein